MESDEADHHPMTLRTTNAAICIQSVARGSISRQITSSQSFAQLELFDVITHDTGTIIKPFQLYKIIAQNPDRFINLCHQSEFKCYCTPKTMLGTLKRLELSLEMDFTTFVEVSTSSNPKSPKSPAHPPSSSIVTLYNHFNANPTLQTLTTAFANDPDTTAQYIKDADMPCLLLPKTATVAFAGITATRKQLAPSSMMERVEEKRNTPTTLAEFATLTDFNANETTDQVAEIYSELCFYTKKNASVSLLSLHRALSHATKDQTDTDQLPHKLRQAHMECLLSPKSATKAFSQLRSVQETTASDSLLTLKQFRTLAHQSFPNSPPPSPKPFDPVMDIYGMMQNCQKTGGRRLTTTREPSTLGIDTDDDTEQEQEREFEPVTLSVGLWLSLLYRHNNLDQLIDTVKLAQLSALLTPSHAVQGFQEMKCMSYLQHREHISVDDLRFFSTNGLQWTTASIKLQYFARKIVQTYTTKQSAASKIQKSYRWNFNLLPWSVAAIRIQRQWRNILHVAHVKDAQEYIDGIIDNMLKRRAERIRMMCQNSIHVVLNVLFQSRHLKILDVIRDQRIETLSQQRASVIQLWYRRMKKAYLFDCWVFKYKHRRDTSAMHIQKNIRRHLVVSNRKKILHKAAVVIQDGWKSRTIYPEEAMCMAEERKKSIVLVQAGWRGSLCRHALKRNYIFWWCVPKLQGIVRGYLFRVCNPLGRYFTAHLPMYIESWKRCTSIEQSNQKSMQQRIALKNTVKYTKQKNVQTYQAIDRVQEKRNALRDQPLQHLNKVERQLKFIQSADKRRKQKQLLQKRRAMGEGGAWGNAVAAPTRSSSGTNNNNTKQRSFSLSPHKKSRLILPNLPLSPSKEVSKGGTAFTLCDQQRALEMVQDEMKRADQEMIQLRLQINQLKHKLQSDQRKVAAECQVKVDQAHRTVTDRQLRHERAVSQLKVVYDAHQEIIMRQSHGGKVENDDPFRNTLMMNASDSCDDYDYGSPNNNGEDERLEWSGVGLVEKMNMNSPKGF
mgnify:FL=1